MEQIFRAAAVYFIILILFRLAGRRTFSEMTAFDFVLLLIISECLQQALVGEDFSVTGAVIVAMTLIGIDIGLSLLKQAAPAMEKILDGLPVIVVENGRPLKDRMNEARIDENDVLDEARRLRGLERMDQIKYAVLERNGEISIIPADSKGS